MSVNNVSTDYGDEIYAEPSLEYIDIVVVAMPALAVVGNGVAVVVLMICKRIPFQIKYIFINLISSDALCVSRVPSCHLHVFFLFSPLFCTAYMYITKSTNYMIHILMYVHSFSPTQ